MKTLIISTLLCMLLTSCKTTPGAESDIEFFLDSFGTGVHIITW